VCVEVWFEVDVFEDCVWDFEVGVGVERGVVD